MMSPRFSAIVMLQGHAQTRIDRHDDVRLAAHSGVSALYGDTVAMTGIHAPGQRLRSINLSLSDPDGAGDDQTSEMIWKALRSPSLRLRRWQVQGHLLQAIEHLLDCGWDGPLQAMLREGVGTQLLAHALATLEQRAPADSTVSERDRQLLERVRERLYSAPGEEHTLDELARLACMSEHAARQIPGDLPALGLQLAARTAAGSGARTTGPRVQRATGGAFRRLPPRHQLRHGVPRALRHRSQRTELSAGRARLTAAPIALAAFTIPATHDDRRPCGCASQPGRPPPWMPSCHAANPCLPFP